MVEEASNEVKEDETEAINEGIGRPTSKRKAKASQIEKQCSCKKSSRDLLCLSHGEKKWLKRK